ncbi:hypothetical protein [Sphingomonas sp.]|uniref:hypothetical protein n=1 Tax=Sphingomonas sp. TaxID=28214 RepID=UPI003AFFDEC7
MKAALNRAAESRDWMPIAAWSKVKPFKGVDVAKRRYLNDDEARRLVSASEPEFGRWSGQRCSPATDMASFVTLR